VVDACGVKMVALGVILKKKRLIFFYQPHH